MGSDANSLILEIKGNSLDDGPGIRSIVFFKGCPLDCVWCHNPESKSRNVEISFDSLQCVDCGSCRDICKFSALAKSNPFYIDRQQCQLCFDCVEVCPGNALTRVGQNMDIDTILPRILRDKPFFDNTGGGVTLSGGEPALNMNFVGELLKHLQAEQIHTLLETCGHFDYARFAEKVLPYTNTIYFDLKIMDSTAHKQYCGVGNRLILKNFMRLVKDGADILPRTPLVPGITDTDTNLKAIAEFLSGLGITQCSLLPYNPLWREKCKQIGVPYSFTDSQQHQSWTSAEKKQQCAGIFKKYGIKTI